MENRSRSGIAFGWQESAGDTRSSKGPVFLRTAHLTAHLANETRWPSVRESHRAIYARHGITNVGYWIPQQSDPELGISAENTFIYIRAYPSKEERDKRLKARGDDPEFAEVVTKQERNPDTRLIVKVHNIDMVPHGTYSAITVNK